MITTIMVMENIGAATVIRITTTITDMKSIFTIFLRPRRRREGLEAVRLCWWVLEILT